MTDDLALLSLAVPMLALSLVHLWYGHEGWLYATTADADDCRHRVTESEAS